MVLDRSTVEFLTKEVENLLGPEQDEKDAAGIFVPHNVDIAIENRVVRKIIERFKVYVHS